MSIITARMQLQKSYSKLWSPLVKERYAYLPPPPEGWLHRNKLWRSQSCGTFAQGNLTRKSICPRFSDGLLIGVGNCHMRWFSQHAYSVKNRKTKTFYDVLGVLPSVTQTEIKSAYYELSLKYHPDVNNSEEARDKFRELTAAYNTLSRLDTRRDYDKDIGTYYMMRSSPKKTGSERVLRLMDDVVEIDMTRVEQSSTFLSSAVTLSTVMRIPVRFNNIRGPKSAYGVQSHDVRMLQLLRQLCNGTLVANKGSSSVTFIPGNIQGGIFTSEAGRITFLSSAVTLSTVMRIPVRFNNIRGPKSAYGVQSHDVRMLQLLRQLCNGTLVANKGSSSVTFIPGNIQGGIFTSEAGRMGSLSLLVESALPCIALGPEPVYSRYNMLSLKGTTHSKYGLHMDYINKVYRPIIQNFGFDFNIEVRKKSYSPHWDGKAVITSLPVPCLTAVNLTDPGTLTKITGWAFVAGSKPIRVAQIMSKNVRSILKHRFPSIPIDIDSVRERQSRTEGTGQGIMIVGETATGNVLSGTASWRKGMSTEDVVDRAVGMFIHNAKNGACVEELVQDKLIPYMALAQGRSVIRTERVTSRTTAAIMAVEVLSEIRFTITKDTGESGKTVLISCEGLGLRNEYLND